MAPRSRATNASFIVGLCAAILVTMAAVFYFGSSPRLFSDASRRFVLASAAIVGLPFALILLATLTGRIAAACLMTSSAATLYLLVAGWPATAMFLLSWEKYSIDSLPFAAAIVQLVALIAAARAKRSLLPAEQVVPFAPLVFLLPVVLAASLGAYAYRAFTVAQEAPAVRAADDAAMEAHFIKLTECLLQRAAAHGGDAPADTGTLDGNCREVMKRIESQANYQIQYTRAPPGADGRHDRFTLCLQPKQVPDDGILTLLSDDRGLITLARAGDRTREAVPCVQANAGTPTGLAKRFEYCMAQYWAGLGRRDYPATLDPIRTALPGCLDGADKPSGEGRSRLVQMHVDYGVDYGADYWLNYTPTPRGEGEPGYWLYVRCSGTPAFAVIDAHGVILNADLPEARAWLNQCHDAEDVDAVGLARAAGLRLPRGLNTHQRSARVMQPAPQDPQFFGEPDLAARRTDCDAQAAGCAGLGRELERAINRAGGTAERDETLNDETREWVREARAAHVRACKAGVARSCHAEAWLASYAHDRDAGHVENFYSLGCDGGYALSCSYLAQIYTRGMSSTVPGIRSVRLAGQPEIRTPTGIDDPKRPAVAKNLSRAAQFYRRACELGDRDGCRLEGMTLAESAAHPEDPVVARANEIFVSLCHRGDWSSCRFLVRNATAAGGMLAGKSTEYWRAQTCLFGGDANCEPEALVVPKP